MRVEVGKDDSKSSTITLKNVYYNSKLPFTLISISQKADYSFTFYNHTCTIRNDKDNFTGVIHESAKLYSLTTKKLSDEIASLSLYELHIIFTNITYLGLHMFKQFFYQAKTWLDSDRRQKCTVMNHCKAV